LSPYVTENMLRFHNKYQQIDVAQGNKRCLLCETKRNT